VGEQEWQAGTHRGDVQVVQVAIDDEVGINDAAVAVLQVVRTQGGGHLHLRSLICVQKPIVRCTSLDKVPRENE